LVGSTLDVEITHVRGLTLLRFKPVCTTCFGGCRPGRRDPLVVKCVRGHLNESTDIENASLIHKRVVRVEVQSEQLAIELANEKDANPKRRRSRNVIEVPWHKTPSTRRREVVVPETGPPQDARPIRSENRAILAASIARGRRWLDELIADPTANTESIART
jgi:hypothetical protein